jgi:hypothetical protein
MKIDAGKSRKAKRRLAAKERFHVIEFINPSGEATFRVAGYKSDEGPRATFPLLGLRRRSLSGNKILLLA